MPPFTFDPNVPVAQPGAERAAGAVNRVLASLGLGPKGTVLVPRTLDLEADILTLVDLLDRQTPRRQALIWQRIDRLLEIWRLAQIWERRTP